MSQMNPSEPSTSSLSLPSLSTSRSAENSSSDLNGTMIKLSPATLNRKLLQTTLITKSSSPPKDILSTKPSPRLESLDVTASKSDDIVSYVAKKPINCPNPPDEMLRQSG